jgi:predicted DNA-binding protein (MmcQ/YjbR family)
MTLNSTGHGWRAGPGARQNGPMGDQRATRRKLLRFSLGLPGAYEDHPWGESVAKVNNKVFVFLGLGDDPSNLAMTVKLEDSHEQALAVEGATPTGYGLGRAGWVTVPLRDTTPPVPVLKDWVEESYRRIAPKRLVAELDARRSTR